MSAPILEHAISVATHPAGVGVKCTCGWFTNIDHKRELATLLKAGAQHLHVQTLPADRQVIARKHLMARIESVPMPPSIGFRVLCPCGWKGAFRGEKRMAEIDAGAHFDQAIAEASLGVSE